MQKKYNFLLVINQKAFIFALAKQEDILMLI